MVELKEYREYLRMPKSINRHSRRIYKYDGAHYMIDRETDTLPKSYRVYALYGEPSEKSQPVELLMNGKNGYFGDNLSWNKAIPKAKVIIDKWIESIQ